MAGKLLLLLLATASAGRVGELARRDTGDIFTLTSNECNAGQCAEHGAGEASSDAFGTCLCACPQRAPLFREDRELCVDDLPECSLATFGTGTGLQRIPFVYLPLKGQIIHPSREITFHNVKMPICAVSGAQFLTRKGFLDLRNTLDADVPFNLFRDEGRTFLQWSGENDVRARMSGRVMVVRLLCRDVAATPESPLDLRGVFTPCVAFRVQGTPHLSNVTEVQFASNAHTSNNSTTTGLTVSEYVAIGISSLLLGLVYVASVFLFLHIRKRRKAASSEGDSLNRIKGLKKKDGSSMTERDIVRVNNERIQSLPNSMGQDNGIVKKNPLLTMNRFQDSKSFPSDSGSGMSDSEDFTDASARSEENIFNIKTTAALIHQHNNHNDLKLNNDNSELNHRDESGIERLPDEHVSIVETTDDREIARPVGTTRRKLYFNPAYFEPNLMAEPPPAALEFLVKIREVIAIAKHKMATKRFQPVLNEIPEEETYSSNGNSIDVYTGLGSQRSGSIISLKRENSRKKNCLGCPGCKTDSTNELQHPVKYVSSCTNCVGAKGDKQSSIRKWLENIPTNKQPYNELIQNSNNNNLANSLLSLPVTEHRHKIRKQNSFTSSSMYMSDDYSKLHKSSSMSVRSEPLMHSHNCNLPLPEFNSAAYQHGAFNHCYGETISKIDDITPIGFKDFKHHSLRNNMFIRRIKSDLPDMINEAIALDHCTKSFNQSSSDDDGFNNSNTKNSNPFTRNNSESPVTNDYETDSLERSINKKGILSSAEYPEIPSSQASPSLSAALPLEEELTMRNAVYKTASSSNSNTPSPHRDISIDLNHYETIGTLTKNKNTKETFENGKPKSDYSLVSEVYVNNNYNFGSAPTSPSGSDCSIGSRKLIETCDDIEEKPGCLTIEVKDSPENYIKIHESDGFEPDTLDRKHPKHKSTHKEHLGLNTNPFIIENNDNRPSQRIQLRSSGTFKKPVDKVECTPFHSLRNQYEQKTIYDRPKLSPTVYSGSKSLEDNLDEWEDAVEWSTDEGRILTLELRHSKRQRQCTPVKTLARPDVLPPLPPSDEDPVYEHPNFPPRKVKTEEISIGSHPKNGSGRSLSPRSFTKKPANETTSDSSIIGMESYDPSYSSMRASVQSQSSEYENIDSKERNPSEFSRTFSKKIHEISYSGINTDTFVKNAKTESKRFRRKKPNIQDSGYLSSDSTSSRQVQRKIVIAKIVSCSESDDTENEARSESGAESVETHSVYFDNFRKPQVSEDSDYRYNNCKTRDSSRNLKRSHN